MAPYLAELLDDPYDAVRFIAYRSLRSLPGFGTFNNHLDLAASPSQRSAVGMRVIDIWRTLPRVIERTSAVPVFDVDGSPNLDVVRLLQQRDNRRVILAE